MVKCISLIIQAEKPLVVVRNGAINIQAHLATSVQKDEVKLIFRYIALIAIGIYTPERNCSEIERVN
ncbi:hypothetical protein B9T07_22115 [Limnospira fusiformis CCALA 023]